MKKLIEGWNKLSTFEKVVFIIAIVLLIAHVVIFALYFFGVTDRAKGIEQLISGIFWGLLGFVVRRNVKWLSVCYFGASLFYLIIAVLYFLM